MSSFVLPASSPECRVELPDNLTPEQLQQFPAFKSWLATLQRSLSLQTAPEHTFHAAPYRLRSMHVQAADWFGASRLGFVKLQAKVTNDNGEWLPGAVFLRGGSVGMLIVIQPDDVTAGTETDKHVLMVLQPRIAAGSLAFAELPAGMLDDGTFAGKAAQEISEETGLEVPEDQLVDMTALALADATTSPSSVPSKEHDLKEDLQNAMYPSPGACDECVALFLYQKRVPRKDLDAWRGKLTGLRDHGEKLTIKLVKLEDLWKEGGRDTKALAALTLYDRLKLQGKI